jgi:hypothetical protein
MVTGKLEEDTGLNHPMHRVFEDGRHGLMEGGSLVGSPHLHTTRLC